MHCSVYNTYIHCVHIRTTCVNRMIYNKNSEISCKRLPYKGHEHTEKDFRFFYGESVNLLAQPHAAAAICCYPLGKTQTVK